MPWHRRLWQWIKDHPWAILVALGSVLGAVVLWKLGRNDIGTLDDAVQVRAAVREIAAKKARAAALEEQADAKAEDITALRREIRASRRRVMEIHDAEPLDGKSDDEVAALFTLAGF